MVHGRDGDGDGDGDFENSFLSPSKIGGVTQCTSE
jgi:hypothetical protein